MTVKSLILKNFRAYKDIKVNFDANMNVIIGQNDIGKSTILEALDIFFGQEVIKIDISDFNKDKEGDKIVIGVGFDIDKNLQIIIDSTNPTNLNEEYLLNQDGYLEIVKEFEVKNDKLSKEKVFINANYPTVFDDPLVTLKIKELKDALEKHGLKSKDDTKSAEIRKTLYENLIGNDSKLALRAIDITKEDAKAIWEQLQKELPLYFLFQSDRANKDSDGDVQNPLKAATKKIVADLDKEFQNIKTRLEEQLTQIGTETINKMKDMGLEVANNLIPKVSNKSLDSLFSFSLESDDGIALNKRGSGFRRMVMLNYFRAEAERKIAEKNNKNVIYAIEEPETAQHPNHQKMLIEALIELSNKTNHQIIITTHTPEIAKMVNEHNLIVITKDKNNPILIEDKEDKLKAIVKTLGIHPFFSNKVVVCVEGEYDIKFLKNVNQNIVEYKNIIDLVKEEISLIPLQGGNLKNWVDRNYLKDSNVIEIHIYDRDSNSGKNTEQYKKQCDEINGRDDKSYAFMTKKRELENYIHKTIIQNEFNITLDDIEDYDNEDIPTFIKNKFKNKNEKEIKEILNGKLSKQLTKQHLEELEAYEEIKSWFEKIKELAQR
ncbi:MAG: ATP-binding protein [Campylobacterales bacterium]|nr:ATP-binding protein [Campylobacterales bacterium]